MNKTEPYFLSVPLAVLRRFVDMNKDKPDNWNQLFELDSRRIFSKSELEGLGGKIESNGTVVVDLAKLNGGTNDN